MRGKVTISGYQDGEYVCEMDISKKVITVYIPQTFSQADDIFSDFNSGNLSGKKVTISSLEISNLENRQFRIISPIDCSIIGGAAPGWSIEDTYGDLLFDLNQKNYYAELKLVPTNLSLTLQSDPLGMGVDLQFFKHAYFLNGYVRIALELTDDSGNSICQFKRKGNYFSVFYKKSFDQNIIYAIALIQGVMPIEEYTVTDDKSEINFKSEVIENRFQANILLPELTKTPEYQRYMNHDITAIEQVMQNYSDLVNNFINGFLKYISKLNQNQKENILRSIEIYTEAKSNPTTIDNKLMLICTVVESLKDIVSAPSAKIDEVLNCIDQVLQRPSDIETNTMIRHLRNGQVHYLDYQIKLKDPNNITYLNKFVNHFNSSLHDVYSYLTQTLDSLYTKLFS